MSGKKVRTLIMAVLLAITIAVGAAPPDGPPIVLASECGSTTGGGG
jgi:hypothetical protein